MNQSKNQLLLTAFVAVLTTYISFNSVLHGNSSFNQYPVIASEERSSEDNVNLVKNIFVALKHSVPKLDDMLCVPVHIVNFIENLHAIRLRSELMSYISKTAPPQFFV
jgi:hypothetical protein